ncbi:hypothetical protein [Natronohydrobacter thiooxidans]|uniref:hypothetical protein n=1 Tax=Natronohydrobacter thiooxidans TaxID=87172 RepID=UPI0008FF5C51|nr:hypothetical protein [Natronohydrobacter thiooxidans]
MNQQTRFDLWDAENRFHQFKRIFDRSFDAIMNDDYFTSSSAELSENYSDDDVKELEELLHHLKAEEDSQVTQAFIGSILLSTYSLFEFGALEMCRHFLVEKGFGLGLRDLSGQGVEKIKIISKLTSTRLPVSGQEWEKVLDYRTIRNVIAHNHGFLDNSSLAKIEKVIERNTGRVALDNSTGAATTLFIGRNFVDESFGCFIRYLRQLNHCFELELSQC